MATKLYLITGSTDGIGRHTAEKLCRAGSHVMVHGRNAARVKDAVDSLHTVTDNHRNINSFIADLSDLSQVRRLADEVKETLERENMELTCLINNAGVYEKQKVLAPSGFEMTWAVNVAAPFLLTSLLLDSIKERIVNVASVSASISIDFNNLQQEKGYSAHSSYSLSKLADIMLSFSLAERLAAAEKGPQITCNCLDPGTVNTKMLYAGWGPIGMRIEDANDLFYLATEAEGVSGKYFVSSRESRAPGPAYDSDARQRLWEILEEQTGAQWSI